MTARRILSLASRADIDRAYRKGTLLTGAFFLVRALRGRGASTRVVVITPKKHFRDAVDRNRITRRTRALLRATAPAAPYDLVILPKKEALRTKPAPLFEDLELLLAGLS